MMMIIEEVRTDTPQGAIATHFMSWKGLKDAKCIGVERVEGEHLWYFVFEAGGQEVELEVSYDGEWDVEVVHTA